MHVYVEEEGEEEEVEEEEEVCVVLKIKDIISQGGEVW